MWFWLVISEHLFMCLLMMKTTSLKTFRFDIVSRLQKSYRKAFLKSPDYPSPVLTLTVSASSHLCYHFFSLSLFLHTHSFLVIWEEFAYRAPLSMNACVNFLRTRAILLSIIQYIYQNQEINIGKLMLSNPQSIFEL